MMLAVESAGGFDALWFGDCAALVKRGSEPAFIVGEAFDKKSAERDGAARLAAKTGLAPAAGLNRPEFLPALRRARNRLNTEGGSWAFGPDARAADHAGIKRVSAPTGTQVLLAATAFSRPSANMVATIWKACSRRRWRRGSPRIGAEIRAIEEADPEGRKFPRFKKSDDATAVLLRVG